MIGQLLKPCNKNVKYLESRKNASPSCNTTRKQSRKGENPTHFTLTTEKSSDFGFSNSWICQNSACRAVLSIDDAYCRMCSCCICHQFDGNKDPSLWLACETGSAQGDSCGLSCHMECAFQQKKLGVVNLGQYMHLDGSYCCASCGKVSGILECWKKQLSVAKDARRADVLCYRINLSYRLLEGTDKFKDLHKIITKAKTKLEADVSHMNGDPAKMAKSIVNRLPNAAEVRKLCSHAIDKANEMITNASTMISNGFADSLPAACRFLFEGVTSSSLVIVLIDILTTSSDSIIGYKLWFSKSQQESFPKEPSSIFQKEKRRITVTNLQPCTEYTFRIISYTEAGDSGHSEARCFTKSVEVLNKRSSPAGVMMDKTSLEDQPNTNLCGSSGFKVRDLGNFLHLAWAQEHGCVKSLCTTDVEQHCAVANSDESPKDRQSPPHVSRDLDLNVVSVPDLNEDLTPPLESSKDEDNGGIEERAAGLDAAAASHGEENNGLELARSYGSGPSDNSQACAPIPNGDVAVIDSLGETRWKRASIGNEETVDSTQMNNRSSFQASEGPVSLDRNFEYCVKFIRKLETDGHITPEFRLKFLSWYGLRSTELQQRVANTFIATLIEDPKVLAGQLIDCFGELIYNKRRKRSLISVPA